MKDIIIPDIDYQTEVKKCKTMEDIVQYLIRELLF